MLILLHIRNIVQFTWSLFCCYVMCFISCTLDNCLQNAINDLCCDIYTIGCQNTPAKGSRFCTDHANLASTFKDDSHLINEASGAERSVSVARDDSEILPIKVMNNEKTRNENVYEVIQE